MAKHFGLDIGSSTVKVFKAEKEGHQLKAVKFAQVAVDPNKRVSELIRLAMKEAGINKSYEVNVAIPERTVYTRIIQIPRLSEAELASAIQYEAEQYVPVSLEEVELYHHILSSREEEVEGKMEVILIAVPKTKIQEVMAHLDEAALMPKTLESEMFSVARVFEDDKKTQLLVSLGHESADMMILDRGKPIFLHSHHSGGLALTRSLANELSLPDDQAEEYKRTYGLDQQQLEGKVAKILIPIVDQLVGQINKAIMFIQQQRRHQIPEQMIICGGGALLPGLSPYLVSKLNMEVLIGDPLTSFKKDQDFEKVFKSIPNASLTTVVGLAIKGL